MLYLGLHMILVDKNRL